MLRWLFFDLGGVLLDESAFHRRMFSTIREVLTEYGHSVSEEAFSRQAYQLVESYAPTFSVSLFEAYLEKEEAERAVSIYRARIAGKDVELQRVFSEVPPMLEEFRHSYSLAIIANQHARIVDLLEAQDLLKYFSFRLISGEIGIAKPAPEIFTRALSLARCTPTEAVMIGDRIDNDVIPAKAFGMFTIRLKAGTWARQVALDPSHAPDLEIHDLKETPQAVEESRQRLA